MTDDRNRDRELEQALTRELRRAEMVEPGGECLDAETLAAWMDGGLGRDAVTLMEAHAAGCPRCRAMIATFASAASPDVPAAESRPRLWRWWLAPIAAATAATLLWVIVPSTDRPSSPSPEGVAEVASLRDQPPAVAPEPPRVAEPVGAAPPRAAVVAPDAAANAQKASPESREEAAAGIAASPNETLGAARQRADAPSDQRARLERSAADAQRDAAAASPPPTADAAAFRSEFAPAGVIVAANSPVRWRATSGGIERSSNAGGTWERVADAVDGVVIAGSAPSRDVCWLVGRAGLVLLTTDGRTFTRLPFPESLDLVLAAATGPRVASVTAADGRVFETVDAGLTWRRR